MSDCTDLHISRSPLASVTNRLLSNDDQQMSRDLPGMSLGCCSRHSERVKMEVDVKWLCLLLATLTGRSMADSKQCRSGWMIAHFGEGVKGKEYRTP